jgi:hypothetical protein
MAEASAYVKTPKVAAKMLANDNQPRIVRKVSKPALVAHPAPAAPVEDAARVAAMMEQVANLRKQYPGLK